MEQTPAETNQAAPEGIPPLGVPPARVDARNGASLDGQQPAVNQAGRAAQGVTRAFSSFKHRNYQLWFSGQLISVIGTWMQSIAQGWLVYQISHSEFALGLVSFAAAIPVLLITPWGGVVVDLVPRRTLLVITQTITMLLAFVLAALAFTNTVQVWHIMVLAVILGVVNAFDAPARQAIIVDLVGREDMTNAIALNSMMFNGARVLGPALGGFLLAWLGTAWCFLINGISFLAVIAGLVAMTIPIRQVTRRMEAPLRQFGEGLRYARDHRAIMGLLILAAVMSTFGMSYGALLPAFVDKVLHVDASGYGAINALIGVGALSGAFLMAVNDFYGKRGRMLLIASLIYPLVLAIFAYNGNFLLTLLLAFGLGFGFMLQGNNMNSLLQLHVDDEMRGRVMSLYTLSFFGLSPFGSLLAGMLGERLPLPITISITAGIMLIGTLIIHFMIPEVRRME
jgi:MFS family permease